jgi:AcrR family transcriptional regulator
MCAARTDRREKIFEAALALIREQGAAAATVRAICDRAGVKPPTIYHYFGDLPGLHRAVTEAVFAESLRRKGGEPRDDALEEIEAGWDAYVDFAADEPNLFAVMNQEIASAPLPANALASFARLEENFRRLGRTRDIRHDPQTAAQMTWAAAHGAACLAAGSQHGLPDYRRFSDGLKHAVLAEIVPATARHQI